jgi:hypothetical protein
MPADAPRDSLVMFAPRVNDEAIDAAARGAKAGDRDAAAIFVTLPSSTYAGSSGTCATRRRSMT